VLRAVVLSLAAMARVSCRKQVRGRPARLQCDEGGDPVKGRISAAMSPLELSP
jgi:hypothetical protein